MARGNRAGPNRKLLDLNSEWGSIPVLQNKQSISTLLLSIHAYGEPSSKGGTQNENEEREGYRESKDTRETEATASAVQGGSCAHR